MTYFFVITFLISLIIFCCFFRNKNGIPTNWPLVGMLPTLFLNFHRINEFFIEIMEKSSELTFVFKGPWFSNMNFIFTVDPSNFHHVLSKSFGNYVKGPKFNDIFEYLGDGIFNSDSSLWRYHRRLAHSFFGHPKFNSIFMKKIWEEMESRLIPLLDNVSKHGVEIDLYDTFKRFTFDNVCNILLDYDPKFLSLDLSPIPLFQAVNDVEEVIFRRHAMPTSMWKFMRWLGVGEEKYQKNCQMIYDFTNKIIAMKREERKLGNPKEESEVIFDDLLKIYMNEVENHTTPINSSNGDEFLKDAFLNFFIAGGDTTSVALSWLFFLLTKNPHVITKIREELNVMMVDRDEDNDNNNNNNNVYLHGAICETLRLYPSVPFNHKNSIESDILPSGHQVKPNMQIIFNMYAQGRLKSIWGDDCNEFKPERWITERGNIKFEPSYKFSVFGAGPRICQGKDMALTQIKIVAAAIIQRYDIEVVQGHQIVPDVSLKLQMKHGFKVKIVRC
ncbi:alkane hydroxylase MAH1-like [Chenopodium quinoa]|uniref:alkane hydroxylase MAH1-like n=1 Tax=Chenopodium quinoa TaxID=63459 RepID=UPI000B7888D8|nr:alkane hydroxylase MAH1-like [Chenopodium quinoa]